MSGTKSFSEKQDISLFLSHQQGGVIHQMFILPVVPIFEESDQESLQ